MLLSRDFTIDLVLVCLFIMVCWHILMDYVKRYEAEKDDEYKRQLQDVLEMKDND